MKKIVSFLTIVLFSLSAQSAFAQEPPWDCQYQAHAKALAAMRGSANVTVEIVPAVGDPEYIRFEPNTGRRNRAFIIQPGGNVDPRAYAVQALAFAEQGIRTYIMGYDLCLAIADGAKADMIFDNDPEIRAWPVAMGGHSLGGVVSMHYILGLTIPPPRYSDNIAGLALWASYPVVADLSDRTDLSRSSLSLWATRDPFVTRERIEESRGLLPPDTAVIAIEGGNHSQYGDYGLQQDDLQPSPDMTQDRQLQIVVKETLDRVLTPMTKAKRKKKKSANK